MSYWAICQITSVRAHRVRSDIERAGCGTFMPTYASVSYARGERSACERPLMPGYLFFATDGNDWGKLAAIDGVHRVLTSAGQPGRVNDEDMCRLVLAHATGEHNAVEVATIEYFRPKRKRRPRPGRRMRAALTGVSNRISPQVACA